MQRHTLRYVFPWEAIGSAPGNQGFALLDGAIRASVRHNEAAIHDRRYAAIIDPAFVLGEFATLREAREAVESNVTARINAMLGVVLPEDVKNWFMQPL